MGFGMGFVLGPPPPPSNGTEDGPADAPLTPWGAPGLGQGAATWGKKGPRSTPGGKKYPQKRLDEASWGTRGGTRGDNGTLRPLGL